MDSVKEILIKRDGMNPLNADILIDEFREELDEVILEGNLEDAEYLMRDYFGLEPDYLEEFLIAM